jgi:hypothetical protein
MRKKFMIATAGIAAAMIMATGCSSKAPAETTPAQTEAAVGTTEAETDSLEVETGEAPGTSAEETTEEGVEVDIPLKISGLIHSVDGNEIVADNQSENSAQGDMILMVDENSTFILDPDGMPVDLADVKEGKFEAYLGPAMTMSLPPQAFPYVVIVNIPEDAVVPQYLVAAGAAEEKDGKTILTATDGTEYEIAADAQVVPYLTKNIVKLTDVVEGSECMADGPFYTAGCGLMLLGNGRIKYLGNGSQHLLVIDRFRDRVPQILIALDMSRYADLMKHLRNIIFQILRHILRLILVRLDLP